MEQRRYFPLVSIILLNIRCTSPILDNICHIIDRPVIMKQVIRLF